MLVEYLITKVRCYELVTRTCTCIRDSRCMSSAKLMKHEDAAPKAGHDKKNTKWIYYYKARNAKPIPVEDNPVGRILHTFLLVEVAEEGLPAVGGNCSPLAEHHIPEVEEALHSLGKLHILHLNYTHPS